MPKRRLGVALLLPPPFDREVDALRRACDDGALGRIPSHLTLVPPVNVREDAMSDALRVLRAASASVRPFTLQLGPPATFLPHNPTLYLAVSGPGADALVALRDRVFSEPLKRPLTWSFVPHVTIADAPFASPAIVGRGGIELELTVSEHGDPDVRAFADREWYAHGVDVLGPDFPPEEPFTIVARRNGDIVGIADGWTHGGVAYLRDLMVAREQRSQGIGGRLLAAFESLAAEREGRHLAVRTWADSRAYGFYRAHGWVDDVSFDWKHGRELVQLRRDL